MREDLPAGTVTFLFTDVEGSTKLLEEIGDEAYSQVLSEHHRACRQAWQAHRGVEVDTEGDAFFVVFEQARDALDAAAAAQEALAEGPVRVRMGLHTGEVLLTETGYVGRELHRAARIAASGHGGQIVLSKETSALAGKNFTLSDLGEHRFKDFPEPVCIFQLGKESFPPLKTISNTNLPRPASSFVGRESELSEVLARVERGARLLTLTGPGGSGKTRLAIEAAATLVSAYKAGVFWVGLASLRDPALVTETISQTLGAKDGLAEHIGEREMLVLLDNLEQVIGAAPELSPLLSSCPNLTLLVTSRELLRVQGEVEYPVPPLAEPEAVSLFCERAQVEPTEEIAELCARLDNLPLAVELAAARVKALSPAQILERLSQRLDLLKGGRDADPRQQTLRATIEWSYDLLSPAEQQLFARLSVFAGGCTLEAAEEVAGADLDTLQSLVEKSLLRFSNERFWMLETMREYAAERLDSREATEIRRRHADDVMALAAEVEEGLEGSEAGRWLIRLEQEQGNLRAALAWMEETEQNGMQLELVGRILNFWYTRGDWLSGRQWAEAALSRSEGERSARRAKALHAAGVYADRLGEQTAAQAYAEESLSIFSELGDPKGIGWQLCVLGMVATELGDYAKAERFYEEAIVHAREGADARTVAYVTGNLGDIALRRGDYERATKLTEEALLLFQQLGVENGWMLGNLAFCLLCSDREEEAVAAASKSLALCHVEGDVVAIAGNLALLGSIAARRGNAESGARLVGAADALRERVSLALTGPDAELHGETVQELRRALGEEAYETALAQGQAMSMDAAVEYALQSLGDD